MSTSKLIKDRLAALQAVQSYAEEIVTDDVVLEVEEYVRYIDEFFNQVEEINEMIDKVQHIVEEVKKKHSSILIAPHSDEKMKQELQDLMAEIRKNSISIREKLMYIQTEKLANKSTTVLRIRKIQHSNLFKKFVDVMTAYNSTQVDYTERYKKRVQRQLDLDIDHVLSQSNPILYIPDFIIQAHQAQQKLSDVEARHAALIKLEMSIRELHNLFLEIMVLVESQTETIDRIEDYMTQTVDHVP